MNKPPAFQFYAADFLVDAAVKHMTLEERGAYVTLLAHSWIDGPLPRSAAKLATLCGVSVEDMARLWPALKPCWKPAEKPGFIINPRLEKERQKQAQYRKSQSDKAKGQQARHRLATAEPVPSSPSPFPRTTKSTPAATRGPKRDPWIHPFATAWEARFQGVAPWGRIGHAFKPLRGQHSDAEILERWTRYLAQGKAGIANPDSFAQTYGAWGPAPTVTDSRISKDTAIRRAFNAGLRGVDDSRIPRNGFDTEQKYQHWLTEQLERQRETA